MDCACCVVAIALGAWWFLLLRSFFLAEHDHLVRRPSPLGSQLAAQDPAIADQTDRTDRTGHLAASGKEAAGQAHRARPAVAAAAAEAAAVAAARLRGSFAVLAAAATAETVLDAAAAAEMLAGCVGGLFDGLLAVGGADGGGLIGEMLAAKLDSAPSQ